MKQHQPTLEETVLSILDNKPPANRVNVCYEGDLEDFFKLEREGICRYYLKRECKKGDQCEFRHEEDQSKSVKYKTKLCKNYMDRGQCKYKEQCSYAHGEKELQASNTGAYS